MRRAIFVGAVGAGKTTLFNSLQGLFLARKTQAVEFNDLGDIDTPGEYFSHPRLYHALISSLVDCELLIYVHAANDPQCRIPSGLLDIYPRLKRIAVITKADVADADVEKVNAMLADHGFRPPIFVVNSFDAGSLKAFKAFLARQGKTAMKKLITANDVRDASAQGLQQICVVLRDCIITPEAQTVAGQLGISISEQASPAETAPEIAPRHTAERQQIREHILAHLPEGSVTEKLLSQLIDKVEQEQRAQAQHASGDAIPASFRSVTGKGGIKVVDGASVNFGRFEGATDHQVGLSDLITARDGSSMAAGFMRWDKGFFPWTLNYDEIDMVLEGELHIRHQGETLVGKAGDVIFIPKGSCIEFGTPNHVRFLYVAWPANWQEC